MAFLANILILALDIYIYIIIASIALSWLIIFGVINTRNPQAANLIRLLDRATEPVYRRLRKYIPPIGGFDIAPIIVIFSIYLLQNIIIRVLVF